MTHTTEVRESLKKLRIAVSYGAALDPMTLRRVCLDPDARSKLEFVLDTHAVNNGFETYEDVAKHCGDLLCAYFIDGAKDLYEKGNAYVFSSQAEAVKAASKQFFEEELGSTQTLADYLDQPRYS